QTGNQNQPLQDPYQQHQRAAEQPSPESRQLPLRCNAQSGRVDGPALPQARASIRPHPLSAPCRYAARNPSNPCRNRTSYAAPERAVRRSYPRTADTADEFPEWSALADSEGICGFSASLLRRVGVVRSRLLNNFLPVLVVASDLLKRGAQLVVTLRLIQ